MTEEKPLHPHARLFLACMRMALKNGDVTWPSDGVPWASLIAIGREQALWGLLYDALCKCPATLRPPKNVWLPLYSTVLRIERQNSILDTAICQLFEAYRSAGARPILIKGQGVARCYPTPNHRTSGDIDIFLPEGFDKAHQWALKHGTCVSRFHPRNKHTEFTWNGISVENHFKLAQFYHTAHNRRLQQIIQEGMEAESPLQVLINGQYIDMLPPTLGLYHLIVHFGCHLVSWGIGLRQCMDILLYMRNYKERIHIPAIDGWIDQTGLRRVADGLAGAGILYLGFQAKDLAFTPSPFHEEAGHQLIRLMLNRGNFGQSCQKNDHRPTLLSRGIRFLRQSREIRYFLPEELQAASRKKLTSAIRRLLHGQWHYLEAARKHS